MSKGVLVSGIVVNKEDITNLNLGFLVVGRNEGDEELFSLTVFGSSPDSLQDEGLFIRGSYLNFFY